MKTNDHLRRQVRRRITGYVWLMAWMIVLYLVAAPWRRLGGLVDERLRWLEWFVLLSGLALGFTLGRFGREAVAAGTGRTHACFLRFLLYPPALITAGTLIVLTLLDERGPIGVVVTALLAYWAGLDLAFGALPLMEGKDYAFERPLQPEVRDPKTPGGGMEWLPPWDRP